MFWEPAPFQVSFTIGRHRVHTVPWQSGLGSTQRFSVCVDIQGTKDGELSWSWVKSGLGSWSCQLRAFPRCLHRSPFFTPPGPSHAVLVLLALRVSQAVTLSLTRRPLCRRSWVWKPLALTPDSHTIAYPSGRLPALWKTFRPQARHRWSVILAPVFQLHPYLVSPRSMLTAQSSTPQVVDITGDK